MGMIQKSQWVALCKPPRCIMDYVDYSATIPQLAAAWLLAARVSGARADSSIWTCMFIG